MNVLLSGLFWHGAPHTLIEQIRSGSPKGHYGDKLVTFQTQVKASEIVNLLGHDPRSKYWSRLSDELHEMYATLQRKTSKGRRDGTRRYIEERFDNGTYALGAFPAIAIGTVNPLRFTQYAGKYPGSGIQRGVGELAFNLGTTSTRVLLDGMARVAGALEILDDGNRELADSFAFPVTIFTPSDRLGSVPSRSLVNYFTTLIFLLNQFLRPMQSISISQTFTFSW
jgi:hypothetical protein